MELGISRWFLVAAVFVYLFAVFRVYRDDSSEIELTAGDVTAFGGLFLLNLAVHWAGLFYSLGGDELFHADHSALSLHWLGRRIAELPLLPIEAYRASMWNLLDPRHTAWIDLLTILSVAILSVGAAATYAYRALVSRQGSGWKTAAAIAGFVLLAAVGAACSFPPSEHPPLRLLPLFVSQHLLGLNAFAFRFPSLLTATVCQWALYWFLRPVSGRVRDHGMPFLTAAAGGFIPVVFYCAEAVEPSIYGFASITLALLLGAQYLRSLDPKWLVWCGVVGGLGPLFRQSTIVMWSMIGVLLFVPRFLVMSRWLVKVALPFLLVLPYFVNTKNVGHTATAHWPPGTSPIHILSESLTSGIGIMSVVNSTTPAWLFGIFLVFVVLLAQRKLKFSEWALFLMIGPSYIVFHMIWAYLWGLGRYQAEYVAPYMALALFFFTRSRQPAWLCRLFVAGVAFLAVTTIQLNSNLSLDTSYNEWPRMRVTTSANLPYREALGFVKRAEAADHMVLLGGQPWYGQVAGWFAGFTPTETRIWGDHQNGFDALVRGTPDLKAVYDFCRANDVRFVVVQSGTRREVQHRSTVINQLITDLEFVPMRARAYFSRVISFTGEHGGVLTVYAVRPE
jgi:hypothetical protein